MGGNSSSLIADLALGWDEYKFMTKLVAEKKFGLCKLLSNNTRYINDLLCLNYLNFHNLINRIYPDSLKMVISGSGNKNINYLDSNINISHEELKISLYNKTKEFNFDVVSFTFPHSNILNELGYSIFYTQVLRYGHISSSIDIFILSLKELYSTMISRGYYRSRLIRCISDAFAITVVFL